MRVASQARKTRPPFHGNAGSRLKTNSVKLTIARVDSRIVKGCLMPSRDKDS